MNHRMISILLSVLLVGSFSIITQAQEGQTTQLQITASGLAGTIAAVDVPYKTIQIGEKIYGLVDGIQVYSIDNDILTQLALAPGQKIEYSLAKQPLEIESNPPLPSQVVTSIRILSGFKKSQIQK